MFNDTLLNKYLESIHYEEAISMQKVLPLYKYGFILKEEFFKELRVHEGFKKTIERYIENRKSITKKELLCILRLYSLEFPDVSPVLPPEIIRILFVPSAQITLEVDDIISLIEITYSPSPQITISIDDIATTINFVPSPQISGDESITLLSYIPVPTIGMELENYTNLVFIPQPTIKLAPADLEDYTTIVFAPVPTIELTDPTPPPVVIDFVPETVINLYESLGISIEFIPELQITRDTAEVSTGNYYYGYRDTSLGVTLSDVRNLLQTNTAEVAAMIAGTSSIGKIQTGTITEETIVSELEALDWNEGKGSTTQAWYFFLTPAGNPSGNIAIRSSVQTPLGIINVGTSSSDGFTSDGSLVTIDGISYSLHITREATVFVSGTYKLLE